MIHPMDQCGSLATYECNTAHEKHGVHLMIEIGVESNQTVMVCHNTPFCTIIRESVDSLCRDGADTPIVRVHRKAFLTRERSRSKPFWAPSYSIPVVLYPTIPPK